MDLSILLTTTGLFYLFVLSLLEIVLGIDNIIFISIITDKLPIKKQRIARNVGLSMALVVRLFLLSIAAMIMAMTDPFFPDTKIEFLKEFSGQSLVLLIGGLFLIYKSTHEMHSTVKGHNVDGASKKEKLSAVIMQIVMVDIVFSFDSIITAIGMTNGISQETGGNPMIIIYMSVIISMIIMLIFVKQISSFINNRPTIKMIALAFLVTIGVVLLAEAFGQEVPKGYIYFAMVYALIVEFINIKMRKNKGEKEI
ncbi:MAG: TerC family protein [Flavobacteriia bacterium]|nr:TerC family protein [Flavobacteriia bacterium]